MVYAVGCQMKKGFPHVTLVTLASFQRLLSLLVGGQRYSTELSKSDICLISKVCLPPAQKKRKFQRGAWGQLFFKEVSQNNARSKKGSYNI